MLLYFLDQGVGKNLADAKRSVGTLFRFRFAALLLILSYYSLFSRPQTGPLGGGFSDEGIRCPETIRTSRFLPSFVVSRIVEQRIQRSNGLLPRYRTILTRWQKSAFVREKSFDEVLAGIVSWATTALEACGSSGALSTSVPLVYPKFGGHDAIRRRFFVEVDNFGRRG